ncbi:MAG: Octaprenyl diphosphate synthase [Phycisphaerae bacterium]|nr:Octaprenyl diphosphate synthase [Phycisphaerae bacterium]
MTDITMFTSTLSLTALYSPIVAELRAVEERLLGELYSDLPLINELCAHVQGYGGKMLRPSLLLLAAQACGGIRDAHLTLATVLELIHLATLVHDDVLDQAEIRRNKPTIARMTSNETAVLVGDYLISHAYHLCSSLDKPAVARQVAACTNRVCEGELLQVHTRGQWSLSPELYLEIIRRKTAALTAAATELAATLSDCPVEWCRALHVYGEQVGIAFQIMDDLLDLTGNTVVVGKSLGSDRRLGKCTLPVIHFRRDADPPAWEAIQAWLTGANEQMACDIESAWQAALQETRQTARNHITQAQLALQTLPPTPAREQLQMWADFSIHRQR